MTAKEMQRELNQWKNAVGHSRSTIRWLEERGNEKNKRIRELESKVKELGGTP